MPELPLRIVPVVLDEDENQKTYYFYVPNDSEISKGAHVTVLTSKGTKTGIAQDDSHYYLWMEEQPPCKTTSMKPVLWVSQPVCSEVSVRMSKIKIPPHFADSTPNPEKLVQKYRLFIKDPKKLGPVQLDSGYTIVDGYITFLLYRMFGHKSVPCSFLPIKAIKDQLNEYTKEHAPISEEELPEEESKRVEIFQPGDIVRIHSSLNMWEGGYVGGEMEQWLGKTVTIKARNDDYYPPCYQFEEDPYEFRWQSVCFTLVEKA